MDRLTPSFEADNGPGQAGAAQGESAAPASPPSAPGAGRASWRRWLGEPLLHFVVLGALLVAAAEVHRKATTDFRVVVTPERVKWLRDGYAAQFGGQPDAATVEALVKQDVRDEILSRHGRALGLDRDDEIIRRRLVQKTEFLTEDLSEAAKPSEGDLRRYFEAHRARYADPAKVTFTHIYFAPGEDDDRAAFQRASQLIGVLSPSTARAPERGDPFPDLYDYAAYDREQVDRLFGEKGFSTALFAAPPGRWVGPIHSSYGWHLARVASREQETPARFEEARERALSDYLNEKQQAGNKQAYDQIAARYKIVRKDLPQ